MLETWETADEIEMSEMLSYLKKTHSEMYESGELDFTPVEGKIRVVYLQDNLSDSELGDWLQIDPETNQIVI